MGDPTDAGLDEDELKLGVLGHHPPQDPGADQLSHHDGRQRLVDALGGRGVGYLQAFESPGGSADVEAAVAPGFAAKAAHKGA